ncbi:cytochrome b5 [Aspergillus fijiensis CBS 313.89]|uniref:Cytochrome b5 n=1 Tax=Aspergillus fijiensis CBS 313.89 TaxID=1448319 RepID=A0A8G1RHC6_9EURO|nr:cytochrome b5 [Aspergillus fijiensis CBS 313.89]RAK72158.1 cytochrome b5 [Aspergillus fijiensis CBS 313.89]
MEYPESLDLDKLDPISPHELHLADGTDPARPTLFAIKGIVFDVSRNPAFAPGGCYHEYAGKDPSHALARSSFQKSSCTAEFHHLGEQEQTILNEWFEFYKKRYRIVGKVSCDSQNDQSCCETLIRDDNMF